MLRGMTAALSLAAIAAALGAGACGSGPSASHPSAPADAADGQVRTPDGGAGDGGAGDGGAGDGGTGAAACAGLYSGTDGAHQGAFDCSITALYSPSSGRTVFSMGRLAITSGDAFDVGVTFTIAEVPQPGTFTLTTAGVEDGFGWITFLDAGGAESEFQATAAPPAGSVSVTFASVLRGEAGSDPEQLELHGTLDASLEAFASPGDPLPAGGPIALTATF